MLAPSNLCDDVVNDERIQLQTHIGSYEILVMIEMQVMKIMMMNRSLKGRRRPTINLCHDLSIRTLMSATG